MEKKRIVCPGHEHKGEFFLGISVNLCKMSLTV